MCITFYVCVCFKKSLSIPLKLVRKINSSFPKVCHRMTLSKLLLLFQDILISKYLDMVLTTARLLVVELLMEVFKEIIQQERLILLGEFSGKVFSSVWSYCKMISFCLYEEGGKKFHVIYQV